MAFEEVLITFFSGNVLGAIGAAVAIALAGLSSAKGLEIAGNTAAGATGEKEENLDASFGFRGNRC